MSRGLISFLVASALLAPMLSPVLGLDLWGRLPDHGHASLSAVTPHTHPWDAPAAEAGHEATPSSQHIAFTPGDLAGAPALPAMLAAVITIPTLMQREVRGTRAIPLALHLEALEPPPPR